MEYGEQGETWQDQIKQRVAELKFAQEQCAAAGIDPTLLMPSAGSPPPQS
jgi:hypothetical protein